MLRNYTNIKGTTGKIRKPMSYNLDSLSQNIVKLLYQKMLDENVNIIQFGFTKEHYEHICIHSGAKEALEYYEKKDKTNLIGGTNI